MNIIIQGPLYSDVSHNNFTIGVANDYAEISEISKVILSTWENEDVDKSLFSSDKIVLLKNKPPDNSGPGNMNLQIVSTREAIKKCDEGLILKTRTDQHLFTDSFYKWMDHFDKNKSIDTLEYSDGTKQKNKIFLVGNNKYFPFHPQDHFFCGYKEDLQRLFNVPLWDSPAWTWQDAPIDFSERLRPNIYIGINYYMQFYPEIQKFLLNEKDYLLDGSPKYDEAMEYYTPIRDSIFGVFPRVEMWWAKHNSGYWYSYEHGGEYYAD